MTVREVIEEVYRHHAGNVVSTHYESCWKYHAGCLASVLLGLMDEEDD